MKKNVLLLSMLFMISCSSRDTIDLLEENLLPIDNKNLLNKSQLSEDVIMDFTIDATVNPENGGCSFEQFTSTGSYMSTAAFGPNPVSFFGRTVRGFGMPRSTASYKGIMFQIGNKPMTIVSPRTGAVTLQDNPKDQAISIEQYFEPNFTYEVTLTAWFTDVFWRNKNNRDTWDDDIYDNEISDAPPTMQVELIDIPKISGSNPCAERASVGMISGGNNIIKKQKYPKLGAYDNYESYTFNFSPTQTMNAIQIYFLPEQSGQRPAIKVPESNYLIRLRNIKIVKKPFDPTHVVIPPTRSSDCGSRGNPC